MKKKKKHIFFLHIAPLKQDEISTFGSIEKRLWKRKKTDLESDVQPKATQILT